MEWYDRIRELREHTNPKLSQTELAQIFNTTQRKISRLETGEAEPCVKDLILICRYYNVSADYILGLDSKNLSSKKEKY